MSPPDRYIPTLDDVVDDTEASKPVAWMHTNAVGLRYFRKYPHDQVFNPQPVYIHQDRKPLPAAQIHELDWPEGVSFDDILKFTRAIERAHGIGGEE